MAAPPPRRILGGDDEPGVTDVMGSILLVGITVLSAAAFGLLLFSFKGPPDELHVDVELRTSPGADGKWATGDEGMELVHLGGETLDRAGTTLSYTADGVKHTYANTQLVDSFSDGKLKIGEVWHSPTAAPDLLNVAQDEAVTATLVARQEVGQLIAAGTVSGGGIILVAGGGSCTPDVGAPTVTLTHTPSNLGTNQGSSAVLVTAVGSDFCNLLDTSVANAPHLWYRVAPGPTPGPASFTDLGAMAYSGGTSNTWTKSIPAPAGNWLYSWGQSLEFYITGLRDKAPTPNILTQSATQADLVDLVGASAYASYPNEVAGSFLPSAPFARAQSDDGVYAQLVESCSTGPPVSNVQGLCGDAATGVSVTSPTLALRSDDQRSSNTGPGTTVQVSGFDVPENTVTSFSGFTISWEGQRGAGGSTSPIVQLEYQVNPTCSGTWVTAGSTFTPGTSDAATTRSVSLSSVISDLESLCVRARVTNSATRALLTDALTITVNYGTATTTYDLNTEFVFSFTLPVGATSGLASIDYRVGTAGETYTLQKWNPVTLSWTSCAGTLASTTNAVFQCTMTLTELATGSPLLRLTGTVDAAAPSSVFIDSVQVAAFS